MSIGASLKENKCDFKVWAPFKEHMQVHITRPYERFVQMRKDEYGYWHASLENVPAGIGYFYLIDKEKSLPDPASHYQPEGVHKESYVVNHDLYSWGDRGWEGIALREMIFYELHVGTFTPEGSFDGVVAKLDYLKKLGINAVELLPVAQFPGRRNWGYDGVYPFAVQASYGGPDGLKRLIDACHQNGIAVILDVVYNHLGPEGNYLSNFAPYFTDKYHTPWGSAVNYDDSYSYGVREYVIENALYWLREFHIDGLRLDAVHGIFDTGAKHILEQLAESVEEFGRRDGRTRYLIAESDLNDTRLIRSRDLGGYGLHAQWSDDFHHAVHSMITGERGGYYEDFGGVDHIVKAYNDAFVYDWRYSNHRKRFHGNSARDLPPSHMVVCTQNHDQIGNRMLGERLSMLVSREAQKLSAGILLLSPYLPLLFQGQEYGETAPFLYFIDHNDPDLIEAVRKGRKQEFSSFKWAGEPPDPAAPETFEASGLRWASLEEEEHAVMFEWYRRLIQIRRSTVALQVSDHEQVRAKKINDKAVTVHFSNGGAHAISFMNFGKEAQKVQYSYNKPAKLIEDSSREQWMGRGTDLPDTVKTGDTMILSAQSFALFTAED